MLDKLLMENFIKWIGEDSPFGDITSELAIAGDIEVRAVVLAKSDAITACTEDLANILDGIGVRVIYYIPSGEEVKSGDKIMEIRGNAKKILLIERTLLNLMIYLFGVASITRDLVNIVKKVNSNVKIAATRKVIPGFRYLTKKAVLFGGGDTHRFSLSDAVIIKDNHIRIAGDIAGLIRRVKDKLSFIHKVEVEVSKVEDAVIAIEEGVDTIMLDNLCPKDVRKVVSEIERRGYRENVIVEVSGGITPSNILEYAGLDIDIISTSYITMHPKRVDLSMEITEVLEG